MKEMRMIHLLLLAMICIALQSSCTQDEATCIEETWYEDLDEDGLGNPDKSLVSCNQPNGYVSNNNDTNDEANTDDCPNDDTYRIANGRACNNIPTDESIFQLNPDGDQVEITFNYVPPHATLGDVIPRERTFAIPANPIIANNITEVANTSFTGNSGAIGWIFGIAVTGVPFDPVANEPWINTSTGERNYEWNLEVLSTNAGLAYDCNNAHAPDRYHYHGTPVEYIATVEDGASHSKLLGYAADGFPIYYKYAFSDPDDMNSSIVSLQSSYQIKEGCRSGNSIDAPDGAYDGTYVSDYGYTEGSGDLDECNGRWSKTPEYPNGTYVYYVTDEFPSIPRCFKGYPSTDFQLNIP